LSTRIVLFTPSLLRSSARKWPPSSPPPKQRLFDQSRTLDAAGPRGVAGVARGMDVIRAVQGSEPRGGAGGAIVAATARAGAPDAVAGAARPAVCGAASAGLSARVVSCRIPRGGNGRAPRCPPLRPPPSRPPRASHHHHSLLVVSSRSQRRVPFSKFILRCRPLNIAIWLVCSEVIKDLLPDGVIYQVRLQISRVASDPCGCAGFSLVRMDTVFSS
jgi:hypothetical protein